MSLARARTFLLGAYHDLPNVLFIGSLILGSISGNLSLVWVSLGLLANSVIIFLFQLIFSIFQPHPSLHIQSGIGACTMFGRNLSVTDALSGLSSKDWTLVTPSHWLAAASFFAVFSIYNSIRVALRPATDGAQAIKVDTRVAFSLSVMVVGVLFMALILARGFSGCETWVGGLLGVSLGSGIAVGYWHLLDVCGAGRLPDFLNVVNGMAPPGSGTEVPILCTPPAR